MYWNIEYIFTECKMCNNYSVKKAEGINKNFLPVSLDLSISVSTDTSSMKTFGVEYRTTERCIPA